MMRRDAGSANGRTVHLAIAMPDDDNALTTHCRARVGETLLVSLAGRFGDLAAAPAQRSTCTRKRVPVDRRLTRGMYVQVVRCSAHRAVRSLPTPWGVGSRIFKSRGYSRDWRMDELTSSLISGPAGLPMPRLATSGIPQRCPKVSRTEPGSKAQGCYDPNTERFR